MINIKECVLDVCRILLPGFSLPFDLQVLILSFSGNLFIGRKSISWTVFS